MKGGKLISYAFCPYFMFSQMHKFLLKLVIKFATKQKSRSKQALKLI